MKGSATAPSTPWTPPHTTVSHTSPAHPSASSSSSSSGPSKKAKKDAAVALCAAIVAVELPEKVPVFAHCDDIRKAINKVRVSGGGAKV